MTQPIVMENRREGQVTQVMIGLCHQQSSATTGSVNGGDSKLRWEPRTREDEASEVRGKRKQAVTCAWECLP